MLKTIDSIIAAKDLKIMVVGDLMLDIFISGAVDRISPESPVPVLAIDKEEKMLGGAGNVLMNLAALGVKPVAFSLVGDDTNADIVLAIARERGIDTGGITKDPSRPTTVKTRYMARHQHLLRTDLEKTHVMDAALESRMVKAIEQSLEGVKAVVLSDYGKGVLTKTLLQNIIAAAKKRRIPVLVDPKGHDYSAYRGADYVTPNRKELGEATGMANPKIDADIVSAARKLIQDCGIGCVIATRSEEGLSVIGSGEPLHIRAQVRDVFDVSGAGDTVIATLAASLAAGADIESAARLANIAAGIAVGKVGTTPVRIEELLSGGIAGEGRQAPLASMEQAAAQVRAWQAKGLKVGFTNGCFDIVHKGHVSYLEQARKNCDRLVVGLNHDKSVRLLKGPTRPVNDENARAAVIGALSSVDLVVLFGAENAADNNTPVSLIDKIRPDIFFKGGDYTIEQLPEAQIVYSYGGTVSLMGLEEGFSTTNIIAKSASSA